MITEQQAEALSYFNEYADDWKNKAVSTDQHKVNIIQQRNGFVLDVIGRRVTTKATLDVGCGTGDLVCDIARLGIDATGIDFAPEMISRAEARAHNEQLTNARFVCASIFDSNLPASRYDVVSANGFIEYIGFDELNRFLDLSFSVLRPGGSIVLGSRNRLFNVFSLNSFTDEEISCGAALPLLKEAYALACGADLAEVEKLETAPLQSADIKHALTGVAVSTRFQYTPLQLINLLRPRGFVPEQIYPVHVHGVSPSFKQQYPQVHTSIANLLQGYAQTESSLLPFSSSFMLHARKA